MAGRPPCCGAFLQRSKTGKHGLAAGRSAADLRWQLVMLFRDNLFMLRIASDWGRLSLLGCVSLVFCACADQSVSGWETFDGGASVVRPDAGAGIPNPPVSPPGPGRDGGSIDSGNPTPSNDAGTPSPPSVNNDAGPEPPPANTCTLWSDCAPFFGDPNSGYACENAACVCDPSGNARQNCTAAGGNFLTGSCYCQLASEPEEPPDVGGTCQRWQDCAPHYGDQNSGFECISTVCTCDPQQSYASRCAEYGGFWVQAECFCAFADEGPPGDADENCYWKWIAPPCDPDRWVDTSHYECRYDERNERRCDVWVESGYWEDGACPTGYWREICY